MFHVPTNDTGPRLNIITFASVSKMWRRERQAREMSSWDQESRQLGDNDSPGAERLKTLHLYFN